METNTKPSSIGISPTSAELIISISDSTEHQLYVNSNGLNKIVSVVDSKKIWRSLGINDVKARRMLFKLKMSGLYDSDSKVDRGWLTDDGKKIAEILKRKGFGSRKKHVLPKRKMIIKNSFKILKKIVEAIVIFLSVSIIIVASIYWILLLLS